MFFTKLKNSDCLIEVDLYKDRSVKLHLQNISLLNLLLGFASGSDSKGSTYNAGDLGSIPELGRFPGGGHGNPLQCSCLENPHGQRSFAGYSPWGRKESDMTERLCTAHSKVADGLKTCVLLLIFLPLYLIFKNIF